MRYLAVLLTLNIVNVCISFHSTFQSLKHNEKRARFIVFIPTKNGRKKPAVIHSVMCDL
jgi:hypothetical protein